MADGSTTKSKNNYLTFTTELLQKTREEITDENPSITHNFGVLTTIAPKNTIRDTPFHIVLTVDHSASMYESMGLLKETIKNIINYLSDIKPKVYITIILFNSEANILTKHTELTELILPELLSSIEELEAQGMTNMEQAFRELNNSYMDNVENIHIFMTDGDPTVGVQTTGALSRLILNKSEIDTSRSGGSVSSPSTIHTDKSDTTLPYEHYFFGFGTEHKVSLLSVLTEVTNGEYFFIDTMKNASIVYGEVLNNILYRKYQYITYTSENIEFYNYKNNEWSNTYVIPTMSSEETKNTHIRFNWDNSPTDLNIAISYCILNINKEGISYVTYKGLTHNIEDYDNTIVSPQEERNTNVMKFMYRQTVLELLFKSNNECGSYCTETPRSPYLHRRSFVPSPPSTPPPPGVLRPEVYTMVHNPYEQEDNLKTKMRELFEEIKDFIKVYDLEDDAFMKQLLDDLYIGCNSYEYNDRLQVYRLSRHISQGQQRAYSVSSIDTNAGYISRRRRRGAPIMQTHDIVGPFRQQSYTSFTPFGRDEDCVSQTDDCEDPVFSAYTVSNDPLTPYTTPQQRSTISKLRVDH